MSASSATVHVAPMEQNLLGSCDSAARLLLSNCTLSAADVQHIVKASYLLLLLTMQSRVMTAQEANLGVMYLWSHAVPEAVRHAITSGNKPFSLAGRVEVIKKVRAPLNIKDLACRMLSTLTAKGRDISGASWQRNKGKRPCALKEGSLTSKLARVPPKGLQTWTRHSKLGEKQEKEGYTVPQA
eukprot:780871-Pelagomonas_calceolata.AAC.3